MERKWIDNIKIVEPYIPGEQPKDENIIKLNTNECPYPPSPLVNDAIKNFDYGNLRLYPSINCDRLKSIISENYNVSKDMIFLGNGSDEVLALCFMTFFNSDKPVLFPDITYSFYDVWCKLYNIKYEKIPVSDNFEIISKDYFKENGGIVIANPNAPTGLYLEIEEIEEIVKNNEKSIVIIDEAYIDFGGESAVSLVNKYNNLVVVHTFSKSRALAGIRVGFAILNSELKSYLEAVKNSFNSYTLNSLSITAAEKSMSDLEYFQKCREKIISTRNRTINILNSIGFKTLNSKSNFVFTTCQNQKASYLYEYLKSKKIIVRFFDKPRINNYLRITIGTDYQMDKLFEELKNCL